MTIDNVGVCSWKNFLSTFGIAERHKGEPSGEISKLMAKVFQFLNLTILREIFKNRILSSVIFTLQKISNV